jgi:hypothetical protein
VHGNELAPLGVLDGISAASQAARSLSLVSTCLAGAREPPPTSRRGRAEEVSSGRPSEPCPKRYHRQCRAAPPEVGETVTPIAMHGKCRKKREEEEEEKKKKKKKKKKQSNLHPQAGRD